MAETEKSKSMKSSSSENTRAVEKNRMDGSASIDNWDGKHQESNNVGSNETTSIVSHNTKSDTTMEKEKKNTGSTLKLNQLDQQAVIEYVLNYCFIKTS